MRMKRSHLRIWSTTTRISLGLSLTLVAAVGPSTAAAKPLTQVPFTYVIDYRPGQIGNADFLAKMKEAPPTL